jgi:hypothetical protein
MSLDESSAQPSRAGARKRKLWLLGIGLPAIFPVAGLVMSGIEKFQDASDRAK